MIDSLTSDLLVKDGQSVRIVKHDRSGSCTPFKEIKYKPRKFTRPLRESSFSSVSSYKHPHVVFCSHFHRVFIEQTSALDHFDFRPLDMTTTVLSVYFDCV